MNQSPQEPTNQNGGYQPSTNDSSYYYNPNSAGQYPTNNGYPSYPNQGQPSSYAQQMGYGTGTEPVEKPQAPQTVKTAVIITYVIAAVGLFSSVLQLLYPDMVMGDFMSKFGVNAEELDTSSESLGGADIVVSAVSALFSLALYVVFAIFTVKGANWARIVLTVLHGLGCLGIISIPVLLMFGTSPALIAISTVNVLLAIAALVFLWLKPSNEFYKKMKAYNQWKTYAQYN